MPPSDLIEKPTLGEEVDIVTEQSKDTNLMELKIGLSNNKLLPSVQKRHVIIDNILYYISNVDSDQVLRLYIPEQLGVRL